VVMIVVVVVLKTRVDEQMSLSVSGGDELWAG
jgi:hypothetical protein